MYSVIWKQVSDEFCATIKITSGFSAASDKFDAIGLIKIIQKGIFNVQSQQYFPVVVQMIMRIFYCVGQEKVSIVHEYYENI